LEFGVRALHALEQEGAWDAAFETLTRLGPHADEDHAIDSTIVRARQHAAGVKGGDQRQEARGRPRGGFSTKIHLRTDAEVRSLDFELTGGEAHEVKSYEAPMELCEARPEKLLADEDYDTDAIRDDLEARGIEPIIPPKSNRTEPIECCSQAYKRRNLIDRCVDALKQLRRIATRYEKTASASLSMLCIGTASLWIKTVNTA